MNTGYGALLTSVTLQDNNIIHSFFNYILNDILEDYRIGYIFYSLLKEEFNDKFISLINRSKEK